MKNFNLNIPVYHSNITANLLSAIKSGRVSHAYVFEGESGLLKRETAEFFARALLCENSSDAPCGVCKSCVLGSCGNNPDFSVVSKGEETNAIGRQIGGKNLKTIPVSAIREAKNDIYSKPFISNRKVYIILDAHLMTVQAQNSLLKVLEEPPLYCTIIMVTNAVDRLLPTVLSRSAKIHFSPLSEEKLFLWQKGAINASDDDVKAALPLCHGNAGKLYELLQNKELLEKRQEILKMLPLLLTGSKLDVNRFVSYACKNKDCFLEFSQVAESYLRDILFIIKGQQPIINKNDIDVLKRMSEKTSASVCIKLISAISYVADAHVNHSAQLELCAASAFMSIY